MGEAWTQAILAAIWLFVIGLTAFMPLLTRRIESFGVTIPESAQQDPVIRKLRKRYVVTVLAIGVIGLIAVWLLRMQGMNIDTWSLLMAGLMLAFMLVSFLVYLVQHRTVKWLKQERGWQTSTVQRIGVDTRFRTQQLILPHYWFLPHVLLTLLSGAVILLNYDRFPDLFPMKYNFAGEVTRSVEKSYGAVLLPVAMQACMIVVFFISNYIIGASKQVVEASNPAASLERNRVFRRRWSLFAVACGFLMVVLFGAIGLSPLLASGNSRLTVVSLLLPLLVVGGAIALSVSTGQGGGRIRLSKETGSMESAPVSDQDEHWKLGQFYYNRSDPAIFVEKRFGIGWTINWARPAGWLLLASLVAVPLLLVWLVD